MLSKVNFCFFRALISSCSASSAWSLSLASLAIVSNSISSLSLYSKTCTDAKLYYFGGSDLLTRSDPAAKVSIRFSSAPSIGRDFTVGYWMSEKDSRFWRLAGWSFMFSLIDGSETLLMLRLGGANLLVLLASIWTTCCILLSTRTDCPRRLWTLISCSSPIAFVKRLK